MEKALFCAIPGVGAFGGGGFPLEEVFEVEEGGDRTVDGLV
jgi:hypothetical protein